MSRVNAKRFGRDLEELGDRAERQEMIKDATAQTERDLAESEALEASLTAAQAKLADHVGNEPDAPEKVREDNIRAVALLVMGTILELVIYLGALPQVFWTWLLLGSAAFSVGAAALVRWQVYDHLYDPQRSKRSIRITRLIASVSTVVFAVALAIWLGVRFATGAVVGLVIWLAVTSLYVAAAAVVLSGSLYAAAAKMRAHPLALARRLRRVQERIGNLRRFLERLRGYRDGLGEGLGGLTGALIQPTGSKAAPSAGPVAAAALAAIIGFGALASPARAQVPEFLCGASSDVTWSQEKGHRREALLLFKAALPRLVEGCTVLLAGHFADEGAFAPRHAYPVPRTVPARDCSTAPVTIPDQARVVAYFKGPQDYFRSQAIGVCEREEAVRRKRAEEDLQSFWSAIATEVNAPQLEGSTATDIVGLIEGHFGVRRLYLLTDGLQSGPREVSVLRIPPGMRVVIVQIPASSVYGGIAATQVAAEQWRSVGVEVVPYTALTVPEVLLRSGNNKLP